MVADKPYDAAERYEWEESRSHRYVECPEGRMRFTEARWALPIPRWLGDLLFKVFGETHTY